MTVHQNSEIVFVPASIPSTSGLDSILTSSQNVIDIEKYGDKYYAAVMHPLSGSDSGICIFSSSTGDITDPSSWSQSSIQTYDFQGNLAHDLKLVSGSNELILYFSAYDPRNLDVTEYSYVLAVTSSNGEDWEGLGSAILSGISGSNPLFSYNGLANGFGNSIDILKDEENNKLIMAIGANGDSPFQNAEYGYPYMASGSVILLSASLDSPKDFSFITKLESNNNQIIPEGANLKQNVSGLYGNSISLAKINNTYHLYSSKPACYLEYPFPDNFGFSIFDTVPQTTRYQESLWQHKSIDGENWTDSKPIVFSSQGTSKGNSFIGFAGIKAVTFNNKIYVFYSEPGTDSNSTEANNYGSAYVAFSDTGGQWPYPTSSNKIKLLEGDEQQEEMTSYYYLSYGQIRRTFSVDAITTENGIYYAFGSPKSEAYDLLGRKGALYFGHSRDGVSFQQGNAIEKEIGTSNFLGTSVALTTTGSEEGEIGTCAYSDYEDVYVKTIGSSIVFKIDVESEKAKKAYKHAAVEPYFGPGLFYNTIKSGISVDWPSISGSNSYNIVNIDNRNIAISRYQPENFIMSSFVGNDGTYTMRGSLRSEINYRIPFENILKPDEVFTLKEEIIKNLEERFNSDTTDFSNSSINKFLQGTYIYGGYETYLNPLDINEIYLYGPRKFSVPFVYRDSKSSKRNSLFTKAMSNCLAEIPNFFLEQQKISVLQSEPDYNWLPLSSGSTYYMDVVLEKSKDLTMMEAWQGNKHPTGSAGQKMDGRYFGYPVNKTTKKIWSNEKMTEEEASIMHNDPAYAPYTPPYFEGTAVARLSFKPTETKKYNLQEVFSNLEIEDIFNEASLGWEEGSDAQKQKMKIASSIELFDYTSATTISVDSLGSFTDPSNTTISEEKDSKIWIIRPRFETPVLNFNTQQSLSYSKGYQKDGGFGKGMWSGYGTIPKEGEEIKLKLLYPFQNERENQYLYDKQQQKMPLYDYIKFKNKEISIGKMAEKKEISEAIVLIPYLDETNPAAKEYGTKKQYVENTKFIKINQDIYNKQLLNLRAGKNAVTKEDGVEQDIIETSISRMIKMSENYVLPPNIDFFKHDDVEPFIMYFFEFKHTLEKEDLSNIWQGVMPDIAYNAELDEVTIEHEFTQFDLFNSAEIPPQMKWLIFKVKKQASISYDNMIESSKNDKRFITKIENGKNSIEYSYNWPYDFFSLVELAKIEIELEYTKGEVSPELFGYTILQK